MYDEIGMSRRGYNTAVKNNTLRIEVLCKICEYAGLNPSDFFSVKSPQKLAEFQELEKQAKTLLHTLEKMQELSS